MSVTLPDDARRRAAQQGEDAATSMNGRITGFESDSMAAAFFVGLIHKGLANRARNRVLRRTPGLDETDPNAFAQAVADQVAKHLQSISDTLLAGAALYPIEAAA